MKNLSGILLAAGRGRRFGSDKLLHPLDDGVPLAVHAARALKAALPRSTAVVDANNNELIESLQQEGLSVVLNRDPECGMGHSIAAGVSAEIGADGWVIALADMPWLKAQTILSVANGLHEANTICAPRYQGRRGHPVGFGKAYRQSLQTLSGDEGARSIIATNRRELLLFDTADSGVVRDVDYPQDLYTAQEDVG